MEKTRTGKNNRGIIKMKIINFGSCNMDYVYSLHHIVTPGETETTKQLEIFYGGREYKEICKTKDKLNY